MDAQPQMDAQPRGGDLRALKALVGGLGVLVVLGTALVIGIVIHRLYAKPATPSMLPVPGVTPVLPAIANQLPAGDSIKQIAAAGDDIAIWVSGPAGDRILLVNSSSGKVTVVITAADK